METNEKLLFSNSFGSVTDKRIVLNYKSGTEDLPLGQITAIRYQHKRNYFFAIGGLSLSIGGLVVMLANMSNVGNLGYAGGVEVLINLLVIIVAFLSGIANWIGHYNIQISAGGKNRKPLKAEISKVREGLEFVSAVKKAMIN